MFFSFLEDWTFPVCSTHLVIKNIPPDLVSSFRTGQGVFEILIETSALVELHFGFSFPFPGLTKSLERVSGHVTYHM